MKKECYNIVQLLLNRGTDIEARNLDRETALHIAAKMGHEQIVHLLLDRGADIEAKKLNSETALHVAAKMGHEQIVHLLLDRGADIEAKNGYLETALHLATLKGDDKIMNLLLDRGADVDAKDKGLRTASQIAFSVKNFEMGMLMGLFVQLQKMQAIREQVILGVESVGQQDAIFEVFWDLPRYCERENDGKLELSSLLTLSGTAERAYATTCEEYLNWCWPESGRETLRLIQSALGQDTYSGL